MEISAINKLYLWGRRAITNGKPITIIKYHSISNMPGPYNVSPNAFLLQIEFIKKNYNIARLSQIKDLFSIRDDGDNRTVILTFDDAYSNFFEIAYPILDRLSIPSTIFVPSGFIGKHDTWDSCLSNYVKRPIMTSRQLIHLKKQGLVDFGSHSVNHQSMANLPVSEMKKEALESKTTLENVLQSPISMFCYPYGHFSKMTTRVLVEAHYDIAVTSRLGASNNYKSILNLKIIYLCEKDTHGSIEAKINGLHDICYIKGYRHIERLGLKLS